MDPSNDHDAETDRLLSEGAEVDARSLGTLTDPTDAALIAAYRELLDRAQKAGNLTVAGQAKATLDDLLAKEAELAQRNAESVEARRNLQDKRRVRQQAEHELQASQERYNTAVEVRRQAERVLADAEAEIRGHPSGDRAAE